MRMARRYCFASPESSLPMLTSRQLYDYRDPTRRELLLVRAGHHLWLRDKALRRKFGPTHSESHAISCALETIWEAKRQVKAELQAERSAKWAKRGKTIFNASNDRD